MEGRNNSTRPEWSPSLRGSGLKFQRQAETAGNALRLPLYEGVD